MINNKTNMKILLIMPRFFDYPEIIMKELIDMGHTVDFFDDRPSTNSLIKAIIRINKKLIGRYIKKYFENIMKTVSGKKYDLVFLISGQSLSLSENMISELKACQPCAEFILYQWDSHKNFPYIKRIQKYFDRCYSFDKDDVEENSNLIFLPLFYGKQYEEIGKVKQHYFKYDLCFVGTAHPKKYKFVNMVSKKLKNIYPKQYIYYFFPSRLVYFYRKIKSTEFKKAHYNEFHYNRLTDKEMTKLITHSKCIIDSSQDGQSGLTIRVLEALGAKRKLITYNNDIINYDFYKPENIYVYKNDIDTHNVFFRKPYIDIDDSIYNKYSLRNWLRKIIYNEAE